ncbi:MAG: aldo/keto reductase [Clostridiales bacterium]|nr:aldo/keto reductase [Clostridiales bacterium]
MIDLSTMPRLGFGLMRLPEKDGQVDVERVKKMVDLYMDSGLNYFDTAYVYHGGKSEEVIREALVNRYPREAFYLTTKMPIWCVNSGSDLDRIFDEQRQRAGVDYFDFYLLHSVEDSNYGKYEKFDCFNWAKNKKAEGKIRHMGFSYHGSPELLPEILDKHPEVEFVQIQLNYADWTNPVVRSGELYEILHERNIPMIVMEPVKGGNLASLKPELEEMLKGKRPDHSIASWAMRFVGSLPGIMTILSGMSSEEQMQDNIDTFKNFEPLTESENELIAKVTKIMLDIPTIGCTSCKYCTEGCPMNISIPDVFRAVNTIRLHGDAFRPHAFYNGLVLSHGRAGDCIGCGQCEGVCPQHLPIIELMSEASILLDKDQK